MTPRQELMITAVAGVWKIAYYVARLAFGTTVVVLTARLLGVSI